MKNWGYRELELFDKWGVENNLFLLILLAFPVHLSPRLFQGRVLLLYACKTSSKTLSRIVKQRLSFCTRGPGLDLVSSYRGLAPFRILPMPAGTSLSLFGFFRPGLDPNGTGLPDC